MHIPFLPLLLSSACASNADHVANICDGGGDLTSLLQINVEVHPDEKRQSLLVNTTYASAPIEAPPGMDSSQINFFLNTEAPTSKDSNMFATLQHRYKNFREKGLLATLMAKAVAALMVFKVLIDCIERYLTDLPACSCAGLMCLILVFIKTLISTLWLLDEEFRQKLGDWSIVGCVYVCSSLMCTPFFMIVPDREIAKEMSENWMHWIFKRESDPQKRQWTVRCFFGLFVAKGLSTIAIFRLFSVQNEVWGERMNSIAEGQVLQGEGVSTSGLPSGQPATPYLITLIYLTLARCSLAIIYERLIKEDSVLDMPGQLYAYLVEQISKEFVDSEQVKVALLRMVSDDKEKIEDEMQEHVKKARDEIKGKAGKIMESLTQAAQGTQDAAEGALTRSLSAQQIERSTVNLKKILNRVISSSFMVQARIKGSQNLTVACAIALSQNRAQQDIEQAVKHLTSCFDPKSLKVGGELSRKLTRKNDTRAQQMFKFVVRHVEQFGKTIVEELRHTIVDVLCSFRIGTNDLGTELDVQWKSIKEDAIAGKQQTLEKHCNELAVRVIEKLAEINLFGTMRDEVDTFIDRKFDRFEEHLHNDIEEMSTKLINSFDDKVQHFDLVKHTWDKMMSTAHAKQDATSILSQKSSGLSTLLKTVDVFLDRLPERMQQLIWWFYSIGLLFVGCLANLLMCKAIYMLGISPPAIALATLGVISNSVCFAFWIWASTGRLNELDDD